MCVCVCVWKMEVAGFSELVFGNGSKKERALKRGITVELSGAACCSEISGGLGGECLDAAGVTVFAEDVSIQRVAALVVPLRKQRAAVLTAVTLHMEIPIQRHYTDRLLLARCRHYWLMAHTAARSKLLVEVLDAVDVVGGVHSERDPVQAAVTHHAGEAVRVVGLARRPQDALHDRLTADVAGLQSVDVARLTVRFLLHSVEGFATQLGAAGHADEAVDMEHLVHCGAAGALAHHILPTAGTASEIFLGGRVVHVEQHLFGQAFQLVLRVRRGSTALWLNIWSGRIWSQAWGNICYVGFLGAERLVGLGGDWIRSP